ncbi:ABC transporter substrate-binding protein [Elusimicrobiota bacterium]
MNKLKLSTICLAVALFSLCLLEVYAEIADINEKNVVIFTNKNMVPYQVALDGFKQKLQDQGVSISAKMYDIGEENMYIDTEKVKESNPDMIISFGIESTRMVFEAIEDVPVIFTMVLNPVQEGFISEANPTATNFTGVSLNIEPFLQLKKITEVTPSLKRIAIMYDPSKSEHIVKAAEKSAGSLGLKLIKVPISDGKEIETALNTLKITADAIWTIPDTTVYAGVYMKHILLFSIKNNIPLIGFSSSFVKAGALFGVYSDYADIGRQTADLSIKLLNGIPVSNIPVQSPAKVNIALNLGIAQRFGVKFSDKVINSAAQVFE